MELEILYPECDTINVITTNRSTSTQTNFCKECGALFHLILVRSRPTSWAHPEESPSREQTIQGNYVDSKSFEDARVAYEAGPFIFEGDCVEAKVDDDSGHQLETPQDIGDVEYVAIVVRKNTTLGTK